MPPPSPPTWPAATGPRHRPCWPSADGRPELLDPLVPGLHYLAAEAVYAVEEEMACSVADVLDRRTRASLRDARGAAEAAARVAALIGPELGWDEARIGRRGRGVRRGHPPRSGPGRTRPGATAPTPDRVAQATGTPTIRAA